MDDSGCGVEEDLRRHGLAHALLIAFTPEGKLAGKMEPYFIDVCAHPRLAATGEFTNRCEIKWMRPTPLWRAWPAPSPDITLALPQAANPKRPTQVGRRAIA